MPDTQTLLLQALLAAASSPHVTREALEELSSLADDPGRLQELLGDDLDSLSEDAEEEPEDEAIGKRYRGAVRKAFPPSWDEDKHPRGDGGRFAPSYRQQLESARDALSGVQAEKPGYSQADQGLADAISHLARSIESGDADEELPARGEQVVDAVKRVYAGQVGTILAALKQAGADEAALAKLKGTASTGAARITRATERVAKASGKLAKLLTDRAELPELGEQPEEPDLSELDEKQADRLMVEHDRRQAAWERLSEKHDVMNDRVGSAIDSLKDTIDTLEGTYSDASDAFNALVDTVEDRLGTLLAGKMDELEAEEAEPGEEPDPEPDSEEVPDTVTKSAGNYSPPESARNNARRALRWKEEYGSECKGGTAVGWARARDLANGRKLSRETVGRMAAFNRHRQNATVSEEHEREPWKDAGHVAWLLWGGTSGIEWAKKIMDSEGRKSHRIEWLDLD